MGFVSLVEKLEKELGRKFTDLERGDFMDKSLGRRGRIVDE